MSIVIFIEQKKYATFDNFGDMMLTICKYHKEKYITYSVYDDVTEQELITGEVTAQWSPFINTKRNE